MVPPAHFRILFVEDSPTDVELELRHLARGGLSVEHRMVEREDDFTRELSQFAPDLVISDFSMPEFNGLAALAIARARTPHIPFMFVSGTLGEEHAILALRDGAADYVLKTNLVRLPGAVERAISQARERAARREAEQALAESEARFRQIADNIADAFFLYDSGSARILYASPAYERIWQRSREALYRDAGSWLERVHPEDRAQLDALNPGSAAFDSSVDAQFRILRPDGELRWIHLRTFVVPGGSAHGRTVAIASDISDRKQAEQRLDYLAYYDSLTGLANRKLFLQRLEQRIQGAAAGERKVVVALLDVERFRSINHALGRAAGDELLKALSQRLEKASGDSGALARVGVDQFAMMATGVEDEGGVSRLLQNQLAACFDDPFGVGGQELRLSGKAGVAIYPNDAADAETILAHAEAALKRAKANGQKWLFFTPELTERIAEKLSMESRLRRALTNEELVLHYQPKVRLATRAIVGVEALIRWNSPELGLVPPMRFIPLMEETGLILEAGTWALKQASRDHGRWASQGLVPPRVAVNVSAIQLKQPNFLAAVTQALSSGRQPPGIDLEITESQVMEDVQHHIPKLHAMCDLGLRIAVDDFGTGYSSLGYLAQLPVHSLKIDRSFVSSMGRDARAMALVATIIKLGQSLELSVIAEGVETEAQAGQLLALGCDEAQGYLFSRPVPFDEISALLPKSGATEAS